MGTVVFTAGKPRGWQRSFLFKHVALYVYRPVAMSRIIPGWQVSFPTRQKTSFAKLADNSVSDRGPGPPLGTDGFSQLLTTFVVEANSVEELVELYVDYSPQLDHINISAFLTRLAKLSHSESVMHTAVEPLAITLLHHLVQLQSIDTAAVSTAVYSVGLLRVNAHKQLAALLTRADILFGSFSPQEVANTVWGLAKVKHRPPAKIIQGIINTATSQLHTFGTQELSNLLYGVALLKLQPGADWLTAFVKTSAGKLHAFRPQELANIMYSLALLRHEPQETWLLLYFQMTEGQMSNFKSQELSNIIWSFAKLNLRPPTSWMFEFCSQLTLRLPSCTTQELSNVMYSFGRLRHKPPAPCLAAFFNASQAVMDTFSPQGLANTIIALNWLDVIPPEQWMARFVNVVNCHLYNCPEITLRTLIHAFFTLGRHYSLELNILECREACRARLHSLTSV